MNKTKTDWVYCPICEEPDMRQETDKEGDKLIFCTNHACKSNGGKYQVIKQQKTDTHLWKIRINDGYVEYEYNLPSKNGDVSIHDIYEIVRKKLDACKCEGRIIR